MAVVVAAEPARRRALTAAVRSLGFITIPVADTETAAVMCDQVLVELIVVDAVETIEVKTLAACRALRPTVRIIASLPPAAVADDLATLGANDIETIAEWPREPDELEHLLRALLHVPRRTRAT